MNPRLSGYLNEYAESHQNPLNKKIHLVAVPAIAFSLVAILMNLPPPSFFLEGLQWAHIFLVGALVFYATLGDLQVFLVNLNYILINLVLTTIWKNELLYPAIGIFVVAWFAQFYGHHIEGKKPAFFKDLFFLLIGPIWVFINLGILKIKTK